MKQATDLQLWDAIRSSDDQSAFTILFERYWQKIFTTSFSWLKDKEQASEIVHDIFLYLWQKRKKLEINSFLNYLTAAARYQVYKRLQKNSSMRISYTGELKEDIDRMSVNEGEQHLHYHDLQQQVDSHLGELPDRCREIYNLSRKEQLTIPEIAERLQISKRTVENQISRALHHLRQCLGDFLFSLVLVCFWMMSGI